VTKALVVETEAKTETAGFETGAEAVASETEAEAVYLETKTETQGSWLILLAVPYNHL